MKKAIVGNLERGNTYEILISFEDCQPEVMTLDEHILYKDIWVAAVVEVPPNISLGYEIFMNGLG